MRAVQVEKGGFRENDIFLLFGHFWLDMESTDSFHVYEEVRSFVRALVNKTVRCHVKPNT